jgi:hypothetical protein
VPDEIPILYALVEILSPSRKLVDYGNHPVNFLYFRDHSLATSVVHCLKNSYPIYVVQFCSCLN